METIPRLLITPGEPAGIGPDIVLLAAQQSWDAELIVVADPSLLTERAKQLGISIHLNEFDIHQSPARHQPGCLTIIPSSLKIPSSAGTLARANASYVLNCLEVATDFCLAHKAALVTGPIQKSIINEAGFDFSGHTEFLAQRSQTPHVIMLFVTEQMKVALLTTHIALAEVPRFITSEKILKTVRLLHAGLKKNFQLADPHILVCGLNPHAGENGHLGNEEINIITPALSELRNEKINITGPLPADTIFTEKYLKKADVILAMYHDQALPVVKYQGFGNAVNMTLGLPFIRTSVDHGTALDIAGTGQADPHSLYAAIHLAIQLRSIRP